MDASIPQNVLAGEVVVIGLVCNLIYILKKTITICLREGKRTDELGRVNST